MNCLKKSNSPVWTLSIQQFDRLWSEIDKERNKTEFYTDPEEAIVRGTFGDLAALGLLDCGSLMIIKRAFAAGASKLHMRNVIEAERSQAGLRKYLNMLRAIKDSPLNFVLRPEADKLLSRSPTRWADFVPHFAQAAAGLMKSQNPNQFIVALVTLDVCGSATKRSNHTETFFACAFSDWFKKMQGRPNWKAVLKIVSICSSDEKYSPGTADNLQENCRKFRARFKHCRATLRAIHTEATNSPLRLPAFA
jgi:hypothetical protein